METNLKNVLASMEARYDHVKDKNNGPLLAATDFNLSLFWSYLGNSSSKLSDEMTKLSLLYSNDPLPTQTEVQGILVATEAAFENFVSTFLTLPKSHGKELYELAHTFVLAAIDVIVAVVKSIIDTGKRGQEKRLRLMGVVWDACLLISENSWDNSTAVLKVIKDEELILLDALAEMDQEMSTELLRVVQLNEEPRANGQPGDVHDSDQISSDEEHQTSQESVGSDQLIGDSAVGDHNEILQWVHEDAAGDRLTDDQDEILEWTDENRLLIAPGMGLVRTARYCLKKLKESVSFLGSKTCCTPEWIHEFDELASKVRELSPAADDFILSIYPPVKHLDTHAAALSLANVITTTLQLARESHYVTEEDQEKIDFLKKATDHNLNKLLALLNVHGNAVVSGNNCVQL